MSKQDSCRDTSEQFGGDCLRSDRDGPDAFAEPAVTPANAGEILNVARRVSAAVPSAFVRVDLYDTPKGVYLGELTFYPGTFYYKNRKLMHPMEAERLGRMWDSAAERLAGSSLS